MSTPSSRHLSHDFPAYKGLTLRELGCIVMFTTASFFLLSLFAGLLLGCAVALSCIGFLTGFIVSVTLMPKPIARLKEGKPHGYLMKQCRQWLASIGVIQSPYLVYCGHWQKNRRLRKPYV